MKCASGKCKNERKEGFALCERCQEASRMSRKKKKETGICSQCPKPAIEGKRNCKHCAEKSREKSNKRRQELIKNGLCVVCSKGEPANDYMVMCGVCYHHKQKETKEREAKQKRHVMEVYGGIHGVRCACPGCDVADLRFLTIDHINGGGNKHAKEHGGHLYRWLEKNNYPNGFQVLCFNCNMGRAINGGVCPHREA